ncbi:hypothetical protein FB451DRAFT_1186678 [Mycena latifolia]|nr:hypothetical protein FB451DRAFT_1186678 [Mycena latifolia]
MTPVDYNKSIERNSSRRKVNNRFRTIPAGEKGNITTNSLPVLQNATVRGLVKMYDFFQTPEGRKIVKQAWRKCELLETPWNLSAECLTGKDSEKALLEYLRVDTALATEIANCCGATHLTEVLLTEPAAASQPGLLANSVPADAAASEELHADFNAHDDSDVSLGAVVQDALGIRMGSEWATDTATFTVSRAAHAEGGNGLIADDVAEYTDKGVRWDEVVSVAANATGGLDLVHMKRAHIYVPSSGVKLIFFAPEKR